MPWVSVWMTSEISFAVEIKVSWARGDEVGLIGQTWVFHHNSRIVTEKERG